uniref:Uncharacterized protein n=1 Tax=Chromera velia CCMP2878 TaxID=1169474 RepID=A0A0G4HPT1_9ALVE|eukprot:Cvel_30061.t1-p1 / transcript=Cvel_30061.t1 / gene=Cvel_30061 / organism=Chromera_velia_CCMP2878 / gene_product=hypothetical protein / transcript_product=hypothetical protein / location=Cvel_scaffold4228:8130-9386(+) / protein_length=214 / sequence_SO=supercontig / SO=protein_coding / is_pseudo=false
MENSIFTWEAEQAAQRNHLMFTASDEASITPLTDKRPPPIQTQFVPSGEDLRSPRSSPATPRSNECKRLGVFYPSKERFLTAQRRASRRYSCRPLQVGEIPAIVDTASSLNLQAIREARNRSLPDNSPTHSLKPVSEIGDLFDQQRGPYARGQTSEEDVDMTIPVITVPSDFEEGGAEDVNPYAMEVEVEQPAPSLPIATSINGGSVPEETQET